jgi:hypothetical protein
MQQGLLYNHIGVLLASLIWLSYDLVLRWSREPFSKKLKGKVLQ